MVNCEKCKELELLLEKERSIYLKIAFRADKYYLQLQAIKDAAFEDLYCLTAGEPENMDGLKEVE